MKDKYTERIRNYELQFEKHEKRHNILGYVKLGAVLISLFLFYKIVTNPDFFYLLFGLLFLEVSILLFIVHAKVDEKREYYSNMCRIYQEYLHRFTGEWTEFSDTGDEFSDPLHPYCVDLDIVGKNSLYQRISTARTWHGRRQFASELLNIDKDEDIIEQRQKAVLELSRDLRANTDFQYYAQKTSEIKKDGIVKLIELLQDTSLFKIPVIMRVLSVCLPVVSLVFMISGWVLNIGGLLYTGIAVVAVQFILWAVGGVKMSGSIGKISSARYQLSGYKRMFELAEETDYNAKLLREIKSELKINDVNASGVIKELNRIIEMINLRNNVFLYVILNVFFLWDYKCAYRMQKWQEKYAKDMEKPFVAAGKLESLLSFSNMAHIEEKTAVPEIMEEKVINAENMGHPLINSDRRVTNSFGLDHEIFIISGSNMSGKTTFLRTLGTNMVLALNGSFVIADKFEAPAVTLATSMRIVDDLNQGISTFYAELTRIKNIVDEAKAGNSLLFLIDEIFRGTNSKDRIEGASAVLEKLNSLNAIGMITTHDLEMCEMENDRIKNYSFSEYYEDGEIYFDYKLKKGMSITTNARFLMEKLGLI